jgi:hypothetical protein
LAIAAQIISRARRTINQKSLSFILVVHLGKASRDETNHQTLFYILFHKEKTQFVASISAFSQIRRRALLKTLG